jgi:hypothetical protein
LGLDRWSTSVPLRQLTTGVVEAWYIWCFSWTETCLSRTEIPGIRGIHKAQIKTAVGLGTMGTGRLGGPNGLVDLVVPELLGGLRVSVVGFGRIWEEGSEDGHLFPVSGGGFRSPETRSVS